MLLAAVMTPFFLMLVGAPRVLLLVRSFSWLGLASLLLSTAWTIYAMATG